MRQLSVRFKDGLIKATAITLLVGSLATTAVFGIKHGIKYWGKEDQQPVKDPTEQTETIKPEDTTNPIINHYYNYYYTCDEDCPCRTEDGGKKENNDKNEDDKKDETPKEDQTTTTTPTTKPGIDIEQVTPGTESTTTTTTPTTEETTTTTPPTTESTTTTTPSEEESTTTTTPSEEQKLPGIGISGPEIPSEMGR